MISTMHLIALLVCCVMQICAGAKNAHPKFNMVHYLGSDFDNVTIDDNYQIQIFCRDGDKKLPLYYFRSATLRIMSAADNIKLIKGANPDDVYEQYKSSTWLFWVANLMPWRMRDASFPTFNTSCVGISTDQPYNAKLVVRHFDPWKVTIFFAGLAMIFLAPELIKSTTFFYSSATLVGALGAALLLLILVTRFLPRGGRGSYAILAIAYSMTLYYAGEAWTHIERLFQDRLPYLIIYISLGALISLILSYRMGPPTNVKTLNIIRWSLQLCGLGLIHLSSDLIEFSTCIIVFLVVYKLTARKVRDQAMKFKYRFFPPKPKLLTEEEYVKQGSVATEQALEELRKFCNSPDCKPWKVVNKLRNPKRFSSFIEGNSHLEDDELQAYESENEALDDAAAADLLTDDDNSPNVTDDET